MFIDALARAPTADELHEIRNNLRMLERAGFAVEDPSNAPLIAPWAWLWARLPRPGGAALPTASREIAEPNQKGIAGIQALARELPAKIDTPALAAAIAKAMPPLVVQNRIDASVFKTALRDSFSLIWVALAAACVGVAGFLGWHFSALHEHAVLLPRIAQQAAEIARQQQVIDKLATAQSKR